MLIIDLHYLAWRAHYVTSNLTNGIIFGTLAQITGLIDKFKDPFIVITADNKTNKRKDLYPEYKNNRGKEEESPQVIEEAYNQINKLKEYILPKIGFQVYEEPGFEADDVIASIVMNQKENIRLPIVVTGDEDLLQLLDYCRIYFPKKEEIITAEKFESLYNIKPTDWIKVKQLGGCQSDNVEGIKGIGEKTVIQWLHNELKISSVKWQKINSFIDTEQAELMLRLVKLPFEGCPIIKPEKPCYNKQGLIDIFKEFSINKIPIMSWEVLNE